MADDDGDDDVLVVVAPYPPGAIRDRRYITDEAPVKPTHLALYEYGVQSVLLPT